MQNRHLNVNQNSANSRAAIAACSRLLKEIPRIDKIDLRMIMRSHAICSMVLGLGTIVLPHSFLQSAGGEYSHYAHEFIRLYGCLTLAIGWIVWKSQSIKDGRLARSLSEVFAISYVLQGLVMLRAQFTNPKGHTFLHWYVALIFLAIGGGYGFIRWVRRGGIKLFALPLSDD